MSYHARLSPSSASRWKSCTASPSESDGKPNIAGNPARVGTIIHRLAEIALTEGIPASKWVGHAFDFIVLDDPPGKRAEDIRSRIVDLVGTPEHMIEITAEHAEMAQAHADYVQNIVATTGGVLFVEVDVPIDHITAEEGATGQADAVIVAPGEIVICDLKTGSKKVHAATVDPDTGNTTPNDQMAMYASGAMRLYEAFGPFEHVRLIINQPSINHVSEHRFATFEIGAAEETLRLAASATRVAPRHVPSADNCFFCAGRFTCEARQRAVIETVFENLDAEQVRPLDANSVEGDALGDLYSKVGLVEQWVEDLKTRVLADLTAGRPVTGYKLVAGKRGAREWKDYDEAEAMLKKMRLKHDEMYVSKLITPTAAEALAKPKKGVEPVIGERQWTKLMPLIVQPDGKPAVAPVSDPRPALKPAAEGFDDLDATPPQEPQPAVPEGAEALFS